MFKISANTLFTGKNLMYMPSCHSTNDIAASLIENQQAHEGMVVVCSEQTAGRGQRGNTWYAEPYQNLTFSLLLKPHFLSPMEQFRLTIAITLGITDALKPILLKELFIKWSNDIYFQNKKIAGILIENTLQTHKLAWSIVGIGLNVNQVENLLPTASSLKKVTAQTFDLEKLLSSLLENVERRYLQLRNGHYERQKAEYLGLLYWYQEKHTFQSKNIIFEGTIIGIDVYGKLAVEVEHRIQYFDFKEIVFLE